MTGPIVILGIFVADATFRAKRAPKTGETLVGSGFALGPGGKGSNQAVAAARAGGRTRFLTRLGQDTFADMALKTWADAGVAPVVIQDKDYYTGAAGIFVQEATGDNAIIVCPGAANAISPADIDGWAQEIREAGVFMTQLEQPLPAAMHGLEVARAAGVTTILNPAPAAALPEGMIALCDYVTPNETEAEGLTGIAVASPDDARRAADALLALGARAAILTLGANGALYHDGARSVHVKPFDAGPAHDTTGAGDCFNGAFATALTQGLDPVDAVRFGCAAAAISVTRPGAAASMPERAEIDALLARD